MAYTRLCCVHGWTWWPFQPNDSVIWWLFFTASFWDWRFCVFFSSGCKQQSLSRHRQKAFIGLLGFNLFYLSTILFEHMASNPWPLNGCCGTGWDQNSGCRHHQRKEMNTGTARFSSALHTPLLKSLQTLWLSNLQSYPPGPRVNLKGSFLEPPSAGYSTVASGGMLSAREIWWTKFLWYLLKLQPCSSSLHSCICSKSSLI